MTSRWGSEVSKPELPSKFPLEIFWEVSGNFLGSFRELPKKF
jgi:hypothetical protein